MRLGIKRLVWRQWRIEWNRKIDEFLNSALKVIILSRPDLQNDLSEKDLKSKPFQNLIFYGAGMKTAAIGSRLLNQESTIWTRKLERGIYSKSVRAFLEARLDVLLN